MIRVWQGLHWHQHIVFAGACDVKRSETGSIVTLDARTHAVGAQ
jgi:hypothetical protein